MKAFALALALVALPAQAATLRCTIESGDKKDSVSVDLEDAAAMKEPALTKNGVYDLSFVLEVSCKRVNCEANATIDSAKAEDEVGQLAFRFRKDAKGRVHGEPLTGNDDGRKYDFYCYID